MLAFKILNARGNGNNGTIVIKTILRSEYFKLTSCAGFLMLSRSHNAGVGWEEGREISKEDFTHLVSDDLKWDSFCIAWESFANGFQKGQDYQMLKFQG